jgi:hypothetical protein
LIGDDVQAYAASLALGQIALGGPQGVIQFDAATWAVRAAWTLPTFARTQATFPDRARLDALAYSLDGRYIAVAGYEDVFLVPLDASGVPAGVPASVSPNADANHLPLAQASGQMEGGEVTLCLTFTPDVGALIAGCSFSGGTSLTLADLGVGHDSGALLNPRELEVSLGGPPLEEYCQWLLSVAVSPSGQRLALFETDEVDGRWKAPGWRGAIVGAEAPFTERRWWTPLDARLTGDARPVAELPQRNTVSYETDAVFISEDEIVCGGAPGRLLCLDAATGALRREIALPPRYRSAEVWGLALGATPDALWCCVTRDHTCQALCIDPRL